MNSVAAIFDELDDGSGFFRNFSVIQVKLIIEWE